MSNKPFQAFKGQDHQAHITTHLNFMASNVARNSPVVMATLEKNIFEHISLMAQEQLEVEFREEIAQLMQMQQMMHSKIRRWQQNPQMQQQMMSLSMSLESRKAKLIAESTEEFRDEEAKITGEYGGDPIAKLKARELDLKAMNDEAERKESEERINLDRSKQMMGQQQFDEKLQQNEDLAELRADTSLEKTQMGIDSKRENDIMKQMDVRILKGPRR